MFQFRYLFHKFPTYNVVIVDHGVRNKWLSYFHYIFQVFESYWHINDQNILISVMKKKQLEHYCNIQKLQTWEFWYFLWNIRKNDERINKRIELLKKYISMCLYYVALRPLLCTNTLISTVRRNFKGSACCLRLTQKTLLLYVGNSCC